MLWTAIMLMASVLTIGAQETAEDVDAKYAANLLKPGTEAPDFTIQNNDSVKDVKLSDFRGKYVVLDFWASWCPDCRKDMPEVKALYEQFGKKGVQFIGISFDTDKAALEQLYREERPELAAYQRTGEMEERHQDRPGLSGAMDSHVLSARPRGQVVLARCSMRRLAPSLPS
jgi:thiol-disulfide isomerase/thioredoxin